MSRNSLPDLYLFFLALRQTEDKYLAYKKVKESILRKQEEVLSREYPLGDDEYERIYSELVRLNDKCSKIDELNRRNVNNDKEEHN
ncbi:hypothetical protein THOM_1794 [Trachipleistophora hominis]|uniref:Uncharacterized protein n=1 Tax=Trachipleistophora hominis TaxID=72359 RepID=L7JX39_TRAHO|nr:hypothetical protein THOM_1794 [Trachipleistophora hominis]